MKLNPIANTLSHSSFSSLIFVKKPRFYSNSTGLAPCSAHHQGISSPTNSPQREVSSSPNSKRKMYQLFERQWTIGPPLLCWQLLTIRSNPVHKIVSLGLMLPKPRPVEQAVWNILIAYQGSFTPSFSFDRNKSMQSFRPMLFFFCAGFLCTLSCSSDSLENNPVLTSSWVFRTQQSLHHQISTHINSTITFTPRLVGITKKTTKNMFISRSLIH